MRLPPSPSVLAVVSSALLCLSCDRSPPAASSSSSPPSASQPSRRLPLPVPSNLLPTPDLAACIFRAPRAPGFLTVSDFSAAETELHVTWQITHGPPGKVTSPLPYPVATALVGLRLEAGGVSRTIALGAHPGWLFARELSVCRDAPRGEGPCSGALDPPALLQGVVSELAVQQWEGYLFRSAVRWMLVRTRASVLLLEATEDEGSSDADRGLCKQDVWRRRLEIPIAPTVTVREEVLVGDPPVKYDCTRDYETDTRCAG